MIAAHSTIWIRMKRQANGFAVVPAALLHSGIERERSGLSMKRDDCWGWAGRKTPKGYGLFYTEKRAKKAHRYALELSLGEIPVGLFALHSCDNRSCCNPNHLRAGTHQDNMDDMKMKKRGRSERGEANHNAKLSRPEVLAIRALKGVLPEAKVSDMFHINGSTVHSIMNKHSWKWL